METVKDKRLESKDKISCCTCALKNENCLELVGPCVNNNKYVDRGCRRCRYSDHNGTSDYEEAICVLCREYHNFGASDEFVEHLRKLRGNEIMARVKKVSMPNVKNPNCGETPVISKEEQQERIAESQNNLQPKAVAGSTEDTGAADSQKHYINSAYQPLQVMQRLMSKEEFCGFLIGNAIKYKLRAGHKDDATKDLTKSRQYAYWFFLVKFNNAVIAPEKDMVPSWFEANSLFNLKQ